MGIFDLERSVIKDENVLLEAFVPKKIIHREGQIEAIANALKPVAGGLASRNVFLFGSTGTGKTSIVKWIFREFSEYTHKVKTVYVNCWKHQTTHSILNEIMGVIGVFTNQKQPRDELIAAIEGYIKRTNIRLVICLDEVDKLSENEMLYIFSRENYGLVLVSNDRFALMNVDARIKSSLAFESIEFPQYAPAELFDILKERAEYGLYPGAIKDEHLKIIAHKAHGDARVAINILKNAALFSEESGKNAVDVNDVVKACDGAKDVKKEDRSLLLDEHKKALYNLLRTSGPMSSGDLFRKYVETAKEPILERTYRKHMESLARQGFIKAVGDGRWRKYEAL